MKRSVVLAFGAAAIARGVVGCAAGEEMPPLSAPAPDVTEAGTPTPNDADTPVDDAPTAIPDCSPDDWCYTRLPLAQSFDAGGVVPNPDRAVFALTSIWVAPDRQAWAVSDAGHVLQWNGAAWRVAFVASAGLRSVWGSSASDVWIAGKSGLLLHGTGTPGALVFAPVSIGSMQTITRVWGTSATDVWLLADRVYHLGGEPEKFEPVSIPTDYGDAAAAVQTTAVWGSGSDTWFAGTETTHCAPPNCSNQTRVFATRRRVGTGDAVTWDTIPMAIKDATGVVGGTSTATGVQMLAIQTRLFDTAFAARVADDPAKLDPKYGAVTVAGDYAWSFEVAEEYGQPEGLWGREANDVWLVGRFGVVRRFDGAAWQVSRVARSTLSPLLNHLHAIDAVTDANGEREMWIVGDDIAMHRTVKR